MALYACVYFAALRPGEVARLRRQDCHLPAAAWGSLTLEKSRPEVNGRWADTGSAHGERGSSPEVPVARLPEPASSGVRHPNR